MFFPNKQSIIGHHYYIIEDWLAYISLQVNCETRIKDKLFIWGTERNSKEKVGKYDKESKAISKGHYQQKDHPSSRG